MLEERLDSVKSGGAVTVAVSLLESFPTLSSPPPATMTVLVIVPTVLVAIVPVTVMVG